MYKSQSRRGGKEISIHCLIGPDLSRKCDSNHHVEVENRKLTVALHDGMHDLDADNGETSGINHFRFVAREDVDSMNLIGRDVRPIDGVLEYGQ